MPARMGAARAHLDGVPARQRDASATTGDGRAGPAAAACGRRSPTPSPASSRCRWCATWATPRSPGRWSTHRSSCTRRHIDDAWVRDSGPTFLTHPDGRLGATHWTFNGWGDPGLQRLGRRTARRCVHRRAGRCRAVHARRMVNEGGGIHVDGEGTVMITETVQLDPGRNPHAERRTASRPSSSPTSASKGLWLPRGLTKDYDRFGTRGHVDIIATLRRVRAPCSSTCSPTPTHPDFDVSQENLGILRNSTDARGRSLEVIEVPAPQTTYDDGRARRLELHQPLRLQRRGDPVHVRRPERRGGGARSWPRSTRSRDRAARRPRRSSPAVAASTASPSNSPPSDPA